jgi:hypothetical protein
MYKITDLEKIMNFNTWSDIKKIDELLRIDAGLYCNLGIDSTTNERNEAKRHSREIYKAIKTLDKDMGDSFLNLMDK